MKNVIKTIEVMPNAIIETDEYGTHMTLHGMGKPDKKHEWLNLDNFRGRGTFTLGLKGLTDKIKIKYGDVVATSYQVGTSDSLKYVGYVVQIRRGVGEFGSDEFFIRHPDGSLMRHSNQCFYILNKEDAQTVLDNSEVKPEDEEGEEGYTCGDESTRKIGFDIDEV